MLRNGSEGLKVLNGVPQVLPILFLICISTGTEEVVASKVFRFAAGTKLFEFVAND